MVISNGSRRHRVVGWLTTKWTIFDLQLCGSGGQRLMNPLRGRGRRSFPNRCRQSPSALSSSRGECTQVVLRDAAWRGSQWQTSFNGEVRESSWPTGPRARWHITASLCAAIPRMRHSGVGKFASDQQGEGWVWSRCQMLSGLWPRPSAPKLVQSIVLCSLGWAKPDFCFVPVTKLNKWSHCASICVSVFFFQNK